MRTPRILSIAASALLMLGMTATAQAFHDGGVARCDGCHTMHNSLDGAVMTRPGTGAGPQESYNFLLQGSDQSSTCLNCHGAASGRTGGYHIESSVAAGEAVANLTPGGDFAWLQKTFTWTAHGRARTEEGESHGHNIIAADHGYVQDSRLAAAPGGNYNSGNLSCISCHDPHGRYRLLSTGQVATTGEPIAHSGSYGDEPVTGAAVGVYRLLGGVGYAPMSYSVFPFQNGAPTAVVPSSYNRSEDSTMTRVGYGAGMSEWCANCHANMHNNTYPGVLRHPVGNDADLGGIMAGHYNSYVASGNLAGDQSTAFNSLVPFETGSTDIPTLAALASNDDSQLGGPESSANVMCLSCHRAHASGWESMMRWNMGSELLTIHGLFPGSDSADPDAQDLAQGRTVAETEAAYNNRPITAFATYQRSMCNKCHAKD